jgi:hypothetical protein
MDVAEYQHVVLRLIILKCISEALEEPDVRSPGNHGGMKYAHS